MDIPASQIRLPYHRQCHLPVLDQLRDPVGAFEARIHSPMGLRSAERPSDHRKRRELQARGHVCSQGRWMTSETFFYDVHRWQRRTVSEWWVSILKCD